MADNLVLPAVGANCASDEVGGAQYQRVKLSLGADGVAIDLAMGAAVKASAVPVTMATDQPDIKISLDGETVVLGAGVAAFGKLAANSGVDIGDVDVTSSALPTGAATAANQATEIAKLAGGFPAALGAGGGLKVDGSGTALPVSGTVTVTQGVAGAPWPVTPVAQDVHLGQVGGAVFVIAVIPTLTVAGLYAANDYVGTSGAAMTFANAVRVTGGSARIVSAALLDYALQSIAAELWLFSAAVTPPADNAPWSISDAHLAALIPGGIIPFTTYYASALNSVSVPATGLNIGFKLPGTILYGCLVTRGGAPTYASGDVTVKLGIAYE